MLKESLIEYSKNLDKCLNEISSKDKNYVLGNYVRNILQMMVFLSFDDLEFFFDKNSTLDGILKIENRERVGIFVFEYMLDNYTNIDFIKMLEDRAKKYYPLILEESRKKSDLIFFILTDGKTLTFLKRKDVTNVVIYRRIFLNELHKDSNVAIEDLDFLCSYSKENIVDTIRKEFKDTVIEDYILNILTKQNISFEEFISSQIGIQINTNDFLYMLFKKSIELEQLKNYIASESIKEVENTNLNDIKSEENICNESTNEFTNDSTLELSVVLKKYENLNARPPEQNLFDLLNDLDLECKYSDETEKNYKLRNLIDNTDFGYNDMDIMKKTCVNKKPYRYKVFGEIFHFTSWKDCFKVILNFIQEKDAHGYKIISRYYRGQQNLKIAQKGTKTYYELKESYASKLGYLKNGAAFLCSVGVGGERYFKSLLLFNSIVPKELIFYFDDIIRGEPKEYRLKV